MRVVERWHGLPRESVGAPSMEIFVLRLDGALSYFIYLEMSLLIAGAGLHDLLKVLSNLHKPGILFYKVHAGLYCLHVLSWAGAGQILTHRLTHSILCPGGAGQAVGPAQCGSEGSCSAQGYFGKLGAIPKVKICHRAKDNALEGAGAALCRAAFLFDLPRWFELLPSSKAPRMVI